MTTDLHPHDPDLEALLRSTLAGRAKTVHDAPEPASHAAERSHRMAWIGGAAAVGVAAAVAVTAAVLLLPGDGTGQPAAGRPTCTAALPDGWRTALAAGALTYAGRPSFPSALTSGGAVISQVNQSDKATDIVLQPVDGAARRLLTVVKDRLVTEVDTDDRYVVVSAAPKKPAESPDSPVDRIWVIDLTTSRVTTAPIGDGVVLGRGAVVQDGVVYWVSGASAHADSGVVRAYTARTRTITTAGRSATGEVDRDVRGVGWVGGSISAAHPPSQLPPFFVDGAYRPVYSGNGTDAWQPAEQSPRVVVRREDGTLISWQLTQNRQLPHLDAASGPLVFVQFNGSNNASVLDTRTGAVASLGKQVLTASGVQSVRAQYVVLVSGPTFLASRTATRSLPGLHC